MTRLPLSFAVAATACLTSGTVAHGQLTLQEPLAQYRFLTGWSMEADSGVFHMAGIQISLADGWKTYWRAPGEFGLPPRLELLRSQNLGRLRMHFPRPSIYFENGIRTIGYANEVVFPLEVVPVDHQRPVGADLLFQIGICREVCIPVSFEIPLELLPRHDRRREEIELALRNNPVSLDASDRSLVTACRIESVETGNGYRITYEFEYTGPIGPNSAAVFESPGDPIWFSDATIRSPRSGRIAAMAEMSSLAGGAIPIRRSNIRITLISGKDYIEFNGCYEPVR